MAKTMPKGTVEAVQAHLQPGEQVVAAAPVVNIVSATGQTMAVFLGPSIGNATDSADAPPRPGFAGMVPAGKILLAVTNLRLATFVCDNKYVPTQPGASFGPEHFWQARFSTGLLNSELFIGFVDNTAFNGQVPSGKHNATTFAKQTAKAATELRRAHGFQ